MNGCFKFVIALLVFMFLVCPGSSLAQPYSQDEYLVWQADRVVVPAPQDTAARYHNFYLRSVSLYRNGVKKWTTDLPVRMKNYVAASIFARAGDPLPDINHDLGFLRCKEVMVRGGIGISDNSGFVMLDKKDGKIEIEVPYPSSTEQFYVDSGRFEIKRNWRKKSGQLSHGSAFVSHVGRYIIHFSGSDLFVFEPNRFLPYHVSYQAAAHLVKAGATSNKAVLRCRKMIIEMTGVVYLN